MTLPTKLKYSCNENFQKNYSKSEPKNETYECNICGKEFYRKDSLALHINSHNFNNSDEEAGKETQNTCNICYKKFTAKKNLLKHLRGVHKNVEEAERLVIKKLKCPEKNCEFLCRMMDELRNHIEKSHKIKILRDTLQFPSETVFQKWKKEEESNTVSWFVMGRKKTTLINGTKKQILYCHRTGHYSPKGFRKYRMRSVGSCKIGVTCPATMEVVELPNGELNVIYYKTHLGHMQDLVYLKLSREERTYIADKINQGFSFDAILEDIKESQNFDKEKKKKIHLLSKKNLYSIMKTENCSNKKSSKKNFEGNIDKNGLKSKEIENVDFEKVEKVKENIHESFTFYSPHNVISSSEKESNLKENPHENIQKYQKDVNIPQTSREGAASQMVILSPDLNHTSVPDIILRSTGNRNQSTIPPQKKVSIMDNHSGHKSESQLHIDTDVIVEKRNKNKSKLHLQLKEKLKKITELLPQSDHLTPKQFDLINAKLNGILDIFNVANNKAIKRKQNLKKKFIKKDQSFRNDGKTGNGIVYKVGENLEHQMYSTPFVYAFYN